MIDPSKIVSLRVHPGLGIARVGNAPSDDEYVLAPEVPGAPPQSRDGAFRDSTGRIRRQVVRFRIYAEFADGQTSELTADDGVTISWTVEIANLKAGWYMFENAMDLPAPFAKHCTRRNAQVIGAARAQLDILPGSRSISGRSEYGAAYKFDTGKFYDKTVYLGELRTDPLGRLLFHGGHGASAPRVEGTAPDTFANNIDWHDDVCDGPVYAQVTFQNGQTREAEPGFIAVTPPNYAPGLFGTVTLEDAVRQMFIDHGELATPARPSFTRDVWPIFDRMSQLQWTNHGLYMLSGHGSPLDAGDPATVKRLASKDPGDSAFRSSVFSLFRAPHSTTLDAAAFLGHYGDYFSEYIEEPGSFLAVTPSMYETLRQWSRGNFDADWSGSPNPPHFDSLSPADQADSLDRAGLTECLGGPFHPGIELTWFMRVRSVWLRPYRLAVMPRGTHVRQDYGDTLTPAECLAVGGPLDGVGPGSLTRSLGVPWQTDEASCQSDFEYSPSTYLSFPSFWGARVPNRVLSTEAWNRANASQSRATQQIKHFTWREDWLRDLKASYKERIKMMVDKWWELGILVPSETSAAGLGAGLPARAWVETGRPGSVTGSNPKIDLIAEIEALDFVTGAGGVAPAHAPAPYVPPRRRLKRDEI